MREHTGLKIVIGLIIAVFIGAQIYSAVYNPITTQSALNYTAIDGLEIVGHIIRQETLVENTSSGTLHFLVEDGERVSKNGTIAEIYNSPLVSITVSNMKEISDRIKDIEEITSYNNIEAPNIVLANTKVNDALNEMIYNTGAGDFSLAKSDSAKLLSAITRRQVITGEQTDFSYQIEQLKSELESLKASLPTPQGSINASVSGYFVSQADGYENALNYENLEEITPEKINSLKPDKVPQKTVGKIVSDYKWYIAANVTVNESLKYKVGDNLEIKTNLKTSPTIAVTVEKINLSQKGDAATVIFSCKQMNSKLASIRSGIMRVVAKQYNGLKLSKDALRVVEGKTGVYVVSGITVKFVPIKIIYTTEEYMLCEQSSENGNVLRLYDEVVVKGKKLYDGKIIA